MSSLTSLGVNKNSTRFAPKVKPRPNRRPTPSGTPPADNKPSISPLNSPASSQASLNSDDGMSPPPQMGGVKTVVPSVRSMTGMAESSVRDTPPPVRPSPAAVAMTPIKVSPTTPPVSTPSSTAVPSRAPPSIVSTDIKPVPSPSRVNSPRVVAAASDEPPSSIGKPIARAAPRVVTFAETPSIASSSSSSPVSGSPQRSEPQENAGQQEEHPPKRPRKQMAKRSAPLPPLKGTATAKKTKETKSKEPKEPKVPKETQTQKSTQEDPVAESGSSSQGTSQRPRRAAAQTARARTAVIQAAVTTSTVAAQVKESEKPSSSRRRAMQKRVPVVISATTPEDTTATVEDETAIEKVDTTLHTGPEGNELQDDEPQVDEPQGNEPQDDEPEYEDDAIDFLRQGSDDDSDDADFMTDRERRQKKAALRRKRARSSSDTKENKEPKAKKPRIRKTKANATEEKKPCQKREPKKAEPKKREPKKRKPREPKPRKPKIDPDALQTLEDTNNADPAVASYLEKPMAHFLKDLGVGVVSKMFKEAEKERHLKRKRDEARSNMSASEREAALALEKQEEEFKQYREAARRNELKEQLDRVEESAALQETSHAPQVRLVNGEIVLDTESLVIQGMGNAAAVDYDAMEVVEESSATHKVNSFTYGKRLPSSRWSNAETEKFYDAISMFGTDFEMVAALLPGRNRIQVRTKFNREERMNPEKINDYLIRKRKPVDLEMYKEVTGVEEFETVPEDFHQLNFAD